MSESKPYTRRVSYHFEAGRERWAVLSFSDDCIEFEETRKNGQEDCHMRGDALCIDGTWHLDEYTRKCIEDYGNVGSADAVEAFFNEHGTPTDG